MYPISDIDKFLDHPIKGLPAAFAVFFFLSCGLHLWQCRRYNAWYSAWPLPIGCVLMAAGFICLEVVAHEHDGVDLASAIQGLFYSAIPTFTLSLYVYLFRLLAGRRHVVKVHPGLYYIVMNCFNSAIITCLAQGSATYFSSQSKQSSSSSGLALVQASLILQLALNVMFLGALYFSRVWESAAERITILLPFSTLIGLILVRNIFRTVQIFVSPLSPLWTQQAYFWVFEAAVTAALTLLLHIMHPAQYIDSSREGCCTAREES